MGALNRIGALINKTHSKVGAGGGAYWKEGSKTNLYGNAGSRGSLVNCLLDAKIFNTWDLSRSKEELGNARQESIGAVKSRKGRTLRKVKGEVVETTGICIACEYIPHFETPPRRFGGKPVVALRNVGCFLSVFFGYRETKYSPDDESGSTGRICVCFW